jgi:hypothetical protein
MRRIGVLMAFVENDAEAQSWVRSRHVQCKTVTSALPRKRTCAVQERMSASFPNVRILRPSKI